MGVEVMVKKYRVQLAEEEQGELKAMVSKGRAAAYKQTHARILLLSDENQADGPLKDQEIARALTVGISTVERVRRRCVEEGVEAALPIGLPGAGLRPRPSHVQSLPATFAMEDVLEVYHRR